MKRVPFDRVPFKTILLSICLLWSAQSTLATTVVRPLDDDMVVGARAIITGKVLQIESALDEQDRIYTYITVRVTEVIKGQITEQNIILKEFGGIVGDRVSVVYGSPQFKQGEKVLLYLGTRDDGSLRTYQMFLGKFSIVRDEATGKKFAERDSGGENVTFLAQGEAKGDSTDRMELSAYTQMVRTKLADNLSRSQLFEETYYKNIPLLASPSGYISSKKQIRPEYTFLGNVRWFEPDSGQPVTYTINPHPSGVPGAPQVVVDPADIAAAAGAWSGISGCSLNLSYVGNLDNCYTQTGTLGINVVSNNCDGYNQPTSGCAGILAIGGYSGGGFLTRVLGGITFGQMTQGFVSFNPWASCYFSDHCNLREIATHELGHALGLGHTADPTGTMYAIAHFDGRCASIKTDDKNGIVFLYPGSGGGPGPLSVVTSSLSGGTVNTQYSQTLSGSGGTLPYNWSIVAGQGTLPPGLGLSSGGSITGAPTTAGTYNFTVRVTDAASGSAQKALSITVVAAGALPLDSQFVSQTSPATLQPGQTFSANMKFLNTGTQTWTGSLFYLVSQNPALNQTWGGYNAVSLNGFSVPPGQQLDVSFQLAAPLTAGAYNFQWQLYKNDGTGFFGLMSANVSVQVGTPVSPDDATFMSQSVPTTMTAGQHYNVSITMQNSGSNTWSEAGGYRLGSSNPTDNWTWGPARILLSSSVSSGSQVTFTFNITAPAVAGSYNFQWRMVHDGLQWFGGLPPNVVVNVTAPGNGSQFISQSVPSTMAAGQPYVISITMKNVGTNTWTSAAGYRLGSRNPTDNWTWGPARVSLPASVGPGSQVTFTFNVTAPTSSGTYNFQWSMVQDGVEWFGAVPPNVPVNVTAPGNSAKFILQSVSSTMQAGHVYSVSITMQNTGTNSWTTAANYRLGSLNPTDNWRWGPARVALPASVSPGAQVTFTFNVTAPVIPGLYNFQWGMVQDGVEWFGIFPPNVAVNVTP